MDLEITRVTVAPLWRMLAENWHSALHWCSREAVRETCIPTNSIVSAESSYMVCCAIICVCMHACMQKTFRAVKWQQRAKHTPGHSVSPAESLCMLSCAVPETLLRLTLAEPSTVLGTQEKALLPATLKSTTPSEGPSSCTSDAEITLAVKVTCRQRDPLSEVLQHSLKHPGGGATARHAEKDHATRGAQQLCVSRQVTFGCESDLRASIVLSTIQVRQVHGTSPQMHAALKSDP